LPEALQMVGGAQEKRKNGRGKGAGAGAGAGAKGYLHTHQTVFICQQSLETRS